MVCAFCGSTESNVKMRVATVDCGVIKLSVCPVDETNLEDTSMMTFISIEKAVI